MSDRHPSLSDLWSLVTIKAGSRTSQQGELPGISEHDPVQMTTTNSRHLVQQGGESRSSVRPDSKGDSHSSQLLDSVRAAGL
jgi:hypothetical protein